MAKTKKPAVKKQLTPAGFGLADARPHSRTDILTVVRRSLKKFHDLGRRQPTLYPGYHPHLIEASEILLNASARGGSPNSPISLQGDTWPKGITPAELAIVGSDFGEVSGSIFLLSSKTLTTTRDGRNVPLTFDHIIYPSSQANKLIDYIAVTPTGEHYNISAKYVKGGAPAISAVQKIVNRWLGQSSWQDLTKLGLTKDTHINAVNVMSLLGIERQQVNVSDLFSGPIEAAQYLSIVEPSSQPARAYVALQKALLHTPTGQSWPHVFSMTADDMQELVDELLAGPPTTANIDRLWSTMTDWLTPYWNAAGIAGKFDLAAIKRGWAKKKKKDPPRYGPLHFPLTYALLNWLNDPAHGALDVLTAAARSLNVCQVRLMNMTSGPKNGIVYRWEPFREHSFEFWSPSHTVLPLNNRMGFRLK